MADTASERLYVPLAVAYVRGMVPEAAALHSDAGILALGRARGLKLHRFKRTMELPRVRAVLGVLRGFAPSNLLDIGTGRGVFLWPLLDTFPDLSVTAVEPDPKRRVYLDAVRRGGIERLTVIDADASKLDLAAKCFDAVTALEVLEHQADPLPIAREAVRLAQRAVIVSVPSKPDDNPEHVQLFGRASLEALLRKAGAKSIRIDYVLNHIVAVAMV